MMRGFIYGPGYYSTWIIYVLPALIVAFMAQATIKKRYSEYSRIDSGTNYAARDVARLILDRNGLSNVRIERVAGNLTDHYDPRSKVLRLSDGVYNSSSVAALGIAAHEVGHAIQDGEEYLPLRLRSFIAPIANLGSSLVWMLIFIGFIINTVFIEIGVALFLGVVLFQVVTLPVEINASRRALIELENGIMPYEKVDGAKKVLQAAAMTYIAAILVSIGELLRILSYINRRRD